MTDNFSPPRRLAPVDPHALPGDVGGEVGGQEQIRPRDVVGLHQAGHGLAGQDVVEQLALRLAEMGGIPKPMTPAEFGKLISDETEKWRKVVEFAGVSVD